jgi:hypothetical protein
MKNVWPVMVLGGAALAAAGALLVVLVDHLRSHPGDVDSFQDYLLANNLRARAIRRARAAWRYHYRRKSWRLSRFARFYVAEIEAADGSIEEMIAAYDPWAAARGIQIVSGAAINAR